MEKRQTAVQWLINEHFGCIENCTPDFRNKIQQALAMEKAQIIHSYVSKGYLLDGNSFENLYKEAEEYYNEIYK